MPGCVIRTVDGLERGLAMKTWLRVLAVMAATCLLALPGLAQSNAQATSGQSLGDFGAPTTDLRSGQPSDGFGSINPYNIPQRHWTVEGLVKDLNGDPVPGAKIVVEPLNGGSEERPLQSDVQGRFYTEYSLNADLTKDLKVLVVASKKGYLKAHETVQFTGVEKPRAIIITLRDPQPDADLLSQEDLIPALTSRLKNLGTADGLSAKSEKDYARGLEDFQVRNRPDHAIGPFSKVVERDPGCVDCRAMLAVADLASGDWDSANRDLEEAVNTSVKDRKAGRPEPLVLYGVLESWRHEYGQAAAYFAEALKYTPKDPLALQEAGRAELMLQKWPAADSYLAQALAAGAGPDARFLRVKALLNEDATDEARAQMALFLNGRDVKNMPIGVRELYTEVQQKKKVEVTYAKLKTEVEEPIDYLTRTTPELKSLRPAADQAPLAGILSAVGRNVEESFRSFPNTSSVEEIHQEKLSRRGKREGYLDQKFYYLCVIPEQSWGPGFSEFRGSVGAEQGQPAGLKDGFMLTSGFTSASLIFHPAYQAQSTFRYLGRQQVDGVDSYVLAFAQIPMKSKLYGTFKSSDSLVTTFTQGLVWVNPQTYQILRLRTDLLKPLPEVKLERQTTDIDYGEVRFKGVDGSFWLPKDVTVTVSWASRNLRNKHEYSGFKVFNVASIEKTSKPNAPAQQASQQQPTPQIEP
jgi:tetratricopeptide (TPR) repeat protein